MPRALHKKPRHQRQRVKDKKSGRVETTDGPKDKRVRAKNRSGDQDAQLSCAEAHQRGCLDPVTAMYRARCPDSKCGMHGAGCPDSNCYEQRAGCLSGRGKGNGKGKSSGKARGTDRAKAEVGIKGKV